jgi:hypothetical protein
MTLTIPDCSSLGNVLYMVLGSLFGIYAFDLAMHMCLLLCARCDEVGSCHQHMCLILCARCYEVGSCHESFLLFREFRIGGICIRKR